MKRILGVLILIVVVIGVRAQVPQGLPYIFSHKYTQFKGFVQIDDGILLPQKDTNFIPIKPALVFRGQDSLLYVYNGSYWHKLASGIGFGKDTTIDDAIRDLDQDDIDNFHDAYQGKVVGLNYDTTTKILYLVLQDGSMLSTEIPIGSGGGGSDGNNYVTDFSFNPANGIMTIQRAGLTPLNRSLDGRYATIQRLADSAFAIRNSFPDTSVFVTKTTFNDTVTYLLDQMQNSGNNYPTDVDFDIFTGLLSIGRNGLPRISTNLDGRYIQRSELADTAQSIRSAIPAIPDLSNFATKQNLKDSSTLLRQNIHDSLEANAINLLAGTNINLQKIGNTIVIDAIGAGGGGGGSLSVVNLVTDLRNVTSDTGSVVFAKGYFSNYDGGGGIFYWHPTSTEPDDSGYVFKVTSVTTGRWIRLVENKDYIRSNWYGMLGDSSLLDIGYIRAWIGAAANRGKIALLSSGVHVFPPDFQYDGLYKDIHIQGEGRAKITTRWGSTTHEIVRRVDLKEPVPCRNCFVRVDRMSMETKYSGGVKVNNGRHDTTWRDVAYTAQIDDYIFIGSDGNTEIASFEDVKAAGLLTELNLVHNTDNYEDGIYVVSATQGGATGGGYQHLELNQSIYDTDGKKVPVLIGTVLKRVGGKWSRVEYTHGFVTGGSLIIDNVIFDDVSFYPFTTKGTDRSQANVPGRKFVVKNSVFRNVSRVSGLDRWGYNLSGSGGWGDWGGLVPGRYNHFLDKGLFNYDKTIIENNEFSYVHCSMFWEFAPTRQLIVRNNYVHDMYTVNEVFLYNPYGRSGSDDGYTNEPTNVNMSDNHILRVRKYSPTTQGYHIFRSFGGNTTYSNNRLSEFTGIAFYAGGANNLLVNNTVEYHVESYPLESGSSWAVHELFHLKGNIEFATGHDELIGNNIVRGGWFQAIDMKSRSAALKITGGRYQDAGYFVPVHKSTDSLREEYLHYILDLPTFQRLATIVGSDSTLRYDSSIAANDYVYWDKRRGIWMKFHKNAMRNVGLIDRSTTTAIPMFNENILITGSEFYGCHLMKIMVNAYDRIDVSNSAINLTSDIIFTTSTNNYINTMRFDNTVITKGLQVYQSPVAYPEVKNFYFNNSTLQVMPSYAPVLTFHDRLEWNNSRAILHRDYDSVALAGLSGYPTSSASYTVTFKGTGDYPQLIINNGYFDHKASRYASISLQGVKEARIKNTEFNLHQWKTNGTSNAVRSAIGLIDNDTIDILELDNIYINSPNISTRSLVTKFTAGTTTTINNLKFGRVYSSAGQLGVNSLLHEVTGDVSIGVTSFTDLNSVITNATILSRSSSVAFPNREVIKVTGSGSYVIPAGVMVDKIMVTSASAISEFKVGSAAGLGDYGFAPVDASGVVFETAISSLAANKTIYFSGATSEVTITIFKR